MSKPTESLMYPGKPTSNIYFYGTIFAIVGFGSRSLAVLLADAGYTGIANAFAWIYAIFFVLLGIATFVFIIGIVVIAIRSQRDKKSK